MFASLYEHYDLGFQIGFRGQRSIPSTLEFCRNKPIRWIYRVILAPRMCHLVTCLLQGQSLLLNTFIVGIFKRGNCGCCRIDAKRRQAAQQLFRHQAVSAESAKHHATGLIAIEHVPGALVANNALAWILCQHLRAAMTTAQQTGEQCLSVPNRSPHGVTVRVFVVGNHRLIALIHVPTNVALVMIQNQYSPVFAAAFYLALNLLTSLQACYRLLASVYVCARIDLILFT